MSNSSNHIQATERIRQIVSDAIKHYDETGYEQHVAEYGRFGDIKDYRQRNAKLDPAGVTLLYRPMPKFKELFWRYEDVFASIPWREIGVLIAYKQSPKKLYLSRDTMYRWREFRCWHNICEVDDPILVDDWFGNSVAWDMAEPFSTCPADYIGKELFRTPGEAFAALPPAHKLTRSEMERRYAEAESVLEQRRIEEDLERRRMPCVYCGQPIGDGDYVRHTADSYAHFACRTCDTCGQTITGDYSAAYIYSRHEEVNGRITTYWTETADILFYHAHCPVRDGVNLNGGGANVDTPFGTRHVHDAAHDLVKA